MPRVSSRRADLLAIADAQLGLITAAQLAELGVLSSTVSRRVSGRMWTRVLPGVHLVDGGEPSRLQRERAALLYAGDTACLSGTTALRRYGVRALRLQEDEDLDPLRPEPVHVLVPHAHRSASTGYARVERTRRLPEELVRREGLLLAPPARAVADAARRMRRHSDVAAIVAETVHRELATVDDLRRELEQGSRRGSAFLRAVLPGVASGAWSAPEVDLQRLLVVTGLAGVRFNVTIVDDHGAYVATPDAWLDDVALAIEVDSVEHHALGEGFERTVRRNARYAAAGVAVVSVLPRDLRERPAGVTATILAARDAAAGRPRPGVRVADRGERSAGREGWRWGA